MKHLRWVAVVCLTIAYIDFAPQLTTARGNTHLYYLPLVSSPRIPLEKLWLSYTSSRDGNWEIYSIRGDGQAELNLTKDPAADWLPAWSPNGTQIAFTSDRDGNTEIYRMQANGDSQLNLTANAANDVQPAWSPDGSQIAFRTDRDGDPEIYLMDSDGSDPVNLTKIAGSEAYPTWSPDGTQIAFVSDRDGDLALYVMRSDGASPARLANTSPGRRPAWSPDGLRIAHVLDHELYITTVSDKTTIQLTQYGSDPDWSYMGEPAWSPNDARILYHYVPYIYSPSVLAYVYTIKADGSESQGTELAEGNSPTWSPDGAYIAFSTKSYAFAGLEAKIVRMRSDGSEQIVLADQGDNIYPTWTFLPTTSP